MNLPEELLQELNRHDWTFEWADDGNSYNAGSAHRKNIINLAKKLKVKREDLLKYVEDKFKEDAEIVSQWRMATNIWE